MKTDLLIDVLQDYVDDRRAQSCFSPGGNKLKRGEAQMTDLKRYLDFLDEELLPKLLVTYGVGIYRPFRFWCLGCPHEALPLDFVRVLDRFRSRMPKFTFRVHVSDDSPDRIARTRQLFRQCGAMQSPEEWVAFQQSRSAHSRLTLREPQDVIACFRNLEQMEEPGRRQLLEDFSRVLFPGRALMGPSLGMSSLIDAPFDRVGKGIYRRVP